MLANALDAVTASIQALLSGAVDDVKDHPGRFSEEELRRIITRPRAVRIAIEDVQEMQVTGTGIRSATVLIAAYVICADRDDQARHKAALETVSTLIEHLAFQAFDSDRLLPVDPKTISAQNLYSGDIDRKGVALWGVSWQQRVKP